MFYISYCLTHWGKKITLLAAESGNRPIGQSGVLVTVIRSEDRAIDQPLFVPSVVVRNTTASELLEFKIRSLGVVFHLQSSERNNVINWSHLFRCCLAGCSRSVSTTWTPSEHRLSHPDHKIRTHCPTLFGVKTNSPRLTKYLHLNTSMLSQTRVMMMMMMMTEVLHTERFFTPPSTCAVCPRL